MKVSYRGFEIDAHRERSLGGDRLLYYSVFRESDQYEVTSGFSDDADTIATHIACLKQQVDDFIENPEEEDEEGFFDDTEIRDDE